MVLRFRFCTSRKGGSGRGDWLQHRAKITWLLLAVTTERPWVGTGWAISLHLPKWPWKTVWPCRVSIYGSETCGAGMVCIQKNDADIQNIFLKCNCSNLKASFSNRKVSSKEVKSFFQRALVLYMHKFPKCSAALFMDRLQLRL